MSALLPAAPAIPLPYETLTAGRVMSRALAAAAPDADRLAVARAFGVRLVVAWWATLTANVQRPAPLRSFLQPLDVAELPDAAVALADSIGEAAAQLDPESAAYQIGLAYTGMLPPEHRSTYGIFYTPPALTARLIDQASEAGVDWTRARVLDPACGGGAFLTPVAQRIIDALSGCSPAILIENIGTRLRGFEIDPFGAWLSQVSLDAVVLPVSQAAGRQLPVVVTVCDSLRRNPPRERFDLVIGNPPYGRVQLPAADRERFKRSLYGHANLYGLFSDLALRHAKAGGVIAYVTPTSFLAGMYFKNLRGLLGRDAPPVTIDFVTARRGVFDDVLQETLLATYRRGGRTDAVSVHQLSSTTGAGLTVADIGKTKLPVDPSQPWLLPRDPLQTALVARLAGMSDHLADWGYAVSTGPLVWNRFKPQMRDRAGRGFRPIVWAEAVTADGRFVFRADKRNHAPFFKPEKRDGWLTVERSCVLVQRTTAKEQLRRLIAAELPQAFIEEHGGVIVENHLNMVRAIGSPKVSPATLAAVLNSDVLDQVFRCISGSVAVSAFELEAIPLPPAAVMSEVERLVGSGAPRAAIERELRNLYGLDLA